jgi:predicted DCC family thiol-disulfide oxidoreductase YuxK
MAEIMKGRIMSATLSRGTLLSAFYDGSCALCRAEMAALHDLDAHGEIAWIDCAANAFDDTPYRAEGVDRNDMMQAMHVRDVLGDWHRGADAIALLYATAGAPRLARLWVHPLTRPLMRRLYPFVARHRRGLSALGLHLVAPRVLRRFAQRDTRCEHGACRHPDPHASTSSFIRS